MPLEIEDREGNGIACSRPVQEIEATILPTPAKRSLWADHVPGVGKMIRERSHPGSESR